MRARGGRAVVAASARWAAHAAQHAAALLCLVRVRVGARVRVITLTVALTLTHR